jgi:hypothetical protein
VAPAAAAAAGSPLVLPSTRNGLTLEPPPRAPVPFLEQRFPGPIAARQTVHVGVAPDGTPRSVRAVQRLELTGLGDYVFAVGAPALDVRPGPGSRSEPGLRRGAIFWQGFSPGRRVLVADATLRPGVAARALPLRVTVADGLVVLENTTGLEANGFEGDAPAAELRSAARALRRAAATGGVADGVVVHAQSVRPRRVTVEAPLEVEGVVGSRRVHVVLGGGRPVRAAFPAAAGAGFRLTARPVLPDEVLERPTLGSVALAVLRLARVRQYDSFLGNPDPRGRVQAEYVYEPARAAAPPPSAAGEDEGWSGAAVGAAAALAVVAGVGLLALWARS